MIVHEIKLRIRYAETDRMGYAYYGNYATYFEVARVEAMRSVGISYKSLEDDGIILPVSTFNVKFFKPAFYDELVTVKVTIKKRPTVRFIFDYEMYNEKRELLNTAQTLLVFTDAKSGKPVRIPAELDQLMNKYYEES